MSSPEPHETNPYAPPLNEDLLRDAMEYRDNFEDEQEFQEALAIWPVCPECGQRRMTICPVCKIAGNLFPLADDEFWFPEPQPVLPEHQACSAHCSDHACQGTTPAIAPTADFLRHYVPDANRSEARQEQSGPDPDDPETIPSQLRGELQPGLPSLGAERFFLVEEGNRGNAAISVTNDQFAQIMLDEIAKRNSRDGDRPLRLVVCHVCSEPFEPRFHNRCEWCGHQFEEEDSCSDCIPPHADEDVFPLGINHNEEFNSGIAAVFVILAMLSLAALGYLWYLFAA